MAVGIYISVPFCRTKCTYCNFASGVFSRALFERYVDRICADLGSAEDLVGGIGGQFERVVDSVYLGGGTPTVLAAGQLERIFEGIQRSFSVSPDAEITVECAPGTLAQPTLDALRRCGVSRVSLGVQSFIDAEAAAIGRLHKRVTVHEDIDRLRAAGITNINIDLIAGLPHQTAGSWQESLEQTIATRVPHVSVYMLEIDEDSRLGSELIAGGARYHAHFVPDEDATADFYVTACEALEKAAIAQYEISNFARAGFQSRHNLKYWTRQPYLGFGVDAHSMVWSDRTNREANRFSTSEVLEQYVAGAVPQKTSVNSAMALEETFFLGLRLNRGVGLEEISRKFGEAAIDGLKPVIAELISLGLLQQSGDRLCLTGRGRLLSNEVFQRFLGTADCSARG